MFRGAAKRSSLLLAVVLISVPRALAQYELPNEIFQRTILIRCGNQQATAFKFDDAGRIYLITTRHCAKKLPLKGAVIERWFNQKWDEIRTIRTLFPSSQDIDLAILETTEAIAIPYKVVKSTEVLTTGKQLWFMGSFPPLKLPAAFIPPRTLRSMPPDVPFVKIGTLSEISPTRADAYEISFSHSTYFSLLASGPIVYWSPVHRDFEVLGVIKREEDYRANDPTHAAVGSVKPGTLRGYSIDLVVDTIHNNSHE